MLNKDYKKIHMVGIGGIGMSALAAILLRGKYAVTGSDIAKTGITDELTKKGALVNIGHIASNVGDADLVVYSSCIRKDNPEIVEARKRRIPIIKRGLLLKEVTQMCPTSIVVAGTHGKTTTTAMISFVLQKCALSPTSLIGGIAMSSKDNVTYGKNDIIVTESDESDGSFLYLKVDYGVITNIEDDHLDYYGNMRSLVVAFKEFAGNARKKFYYNIDDRYSSSALRDLNDKGFAFGFKKNPDIYAKDIKFDCSGSRFNCIYRGKDSGVFTLTIPGIYNILNALPSIAIGLELGLGADNIRDALKEFSGVKRRFEIIGRANGIEVVEDYAHHPTAVANALKTARTFKPKRLVAIFQPHRFTRTALLAKGFAESLRSADVLILTDIYPAGEKPIKGISSKIIYDYIIRKANCTKKVKFIPKEKIENAIADIAKKGDMVIVLGAGDIGELAPRILNEIKTRYCRD